MNKIIINSILLSAILTTIFFAFLYVVTETNVGDWILNLVTT